MNIFWRPLFSLPQYTYWLPRSYIHPICKILYPVSMFPKASIHYNINSKSQSSSKSKQLKRSKFHLIDYLNQIQVTKYKDLQDLLELTPKKICPFHYRGLECKCKSQETPEVTSKFGLGVQNEAGQRLTESCQENALVIANTLFQQHKRRLYTWTSSDGRHQNQIDYILCSQRWRSSIHSAKTRLGADCGSHHEHLIAKFRLKLKKVGKTTMT